MPNQDFKGESRACNCVGPQNGQPLCPCAMQNVVIEDGRYVQKIDVGPVREELLQNDLFLDANTVDKFLSE